MGEGRNSGPGSYRQIYGISRTFYLEVCEIVGLLIRRSSIRPNRQTNNFL